MKKWKRYLSLFFVLQFFTCSPLSEQVWAAPNRSIVLRRNAARRNLPSKGGDESGCEKTRPIKLYWWRCSQSKYGNFGDELTPKILSKIFNQKVVWSDPQNCDMIGCGSIIEHINKDDIKDKIVWSSGFIQNGNMEIGPGSGFVGVRGKLSEARLKEASAQKLTLGDLGLLSSYLLDDKNIKKKYSVGIIPHYTELNDPILQTAFFKHNEVKIISPLDKAEDVIQQIAQCDTIISSSLHGLIVADSLHIPNCYLQFPRHKTVGGLYKYYDYYSVYSNDRLKFFYLDEIQNNISPKQVKNIVNSRYIPADKEIEDIKKNLISSFDQVKTLLRKRMAMPPNSKYKK